MFAWLVNCAQFMVFYLLVTIMAVYAAEQFGAGETASGFASSAFVVGATFARIFSGWAVDALGHKKTLLVSLVIASIACAAYLLTHSLGFLLTVRIIHGAAYAIASTAVMTVAQSVIPHERRAEGTGYFALGTTLATALGPAAGLAISSTWGFNAVFVSVLSLSIVALGLSLILKTPARLGERPHFSLGTVVHPAVAPIGVFMLLIGIAYAGIITFINAYSKQADLETGASLFFITYAAISLIMRFILGRVQDRHGDNIVIYAAIVSFIVSMVLLASAHADWQVIAAGFFAGLGYGSIMPAAQTIAVRSVPALQMGAGISTLFLFMDVGIGFGPIALGSIVAATGYSAMYWLLAGLVAIAAAVYYFVHGRRHRGVTQRKG